MRHHDQASPLPGKKLPSSSPKDTDEKRLMSPTMNRFMSPTISRRHCCEKNSGVHPHDQSSPLLGKKIPPSPKDTDENSLISPLTMKRFMSPTISAASKVHSRKKILGERSESPILTFKDGDENLMATQEMVSPMTKSTALNPPIVFPSSPTLLNVDLTDNPDGDENLMTKQEMGRPDADNLNKPTPKQFVSPMMKPTASEVNPPIAIPSSPRLLDFDLMKANKEIREETDDWSPFSYDPVRNNLVPRPQFLRYKPNKETNSENEEEHIGSDDEVLLETSASKETDSENEEEYIGSDDEVEEENFDDTEMEGSSICRGVLQFVLVLAVLVLSTAYITSMNGNPVEIDGFPNYADVLRHNQEIKSYPVAFVSRIEVNGSWLSLDEDGTPSLLKIIKPHIPLDEGEEVKQVMEKEITEGEEVTLEEEGREDDEEVELLSFQQPLFLPQLKIVKPHIPLDEGDKLVMEKKITESEEVALEKEGQEDDDEEGELLSLQQPLFLPLLPAAEVQSLIDGGNGQMDVDTGRMSDEMVHYREIQQPNDDGVLENGKAPNPRLTTTEVEEENHDYMELTKKLSYDFNVDNGPVLGPILAVIAAASTFVLVLLLCGLKRKKAVARNDGLLPSKGRDLQPAPLSPPQNLIDAFIPERRVAPFKSSGAPTVELLGEIVGIGSRGIGGGTQLKPEKKASSNVQPQPVATAASASSTSSPSSRKKEVLVVGGKGKATNSVPAGGTTTPTSATPLRRSNRLASRGITSP
ncbi:unnamed protein product [Linum trigynum]|uniref:Uncharacterized protein n=1 Tax=Linum trigynum TaxID=586398 RepID=A0AAV2DXU2_9ROSI